MKHLKRKESVYFLVLRVQRAFFKIVFYEILLNWVVHFSNCRRYRVFGYLVYFSCTMAFAFSFNKIIIHPKKKSATPPFRYRHAKLLAR
jgi:hypothetical protein